MLSLDFIQLETTAIIKKKQKQSAISLVVPELDSKNSSELMAKLEKSQTEGHKIANNYMIWFLLGC